MKTIKRVLATTLVLAIIGAPPVSCCEWGICDREYIDGAKSLFSLTSRSESCFDSLCEELNTLCILYGSPWHNLFGPSCCYPDTRCGQRFRQDLKDLPRILNSMSGGTWNSSQDVRIILSLICRHSECFASVGNGQSLR